MLIESRSKISLCALPNAAKTTATLLVRMRDILATNLNTIKSVNSIANLQITNSSEIGKTSQRKKQAIRLLATQTKSLNITLIRIKIATSRITIFILTAHKVIYLTKLFRKLAINREINTDLIVLVIHTKNNSITKTFSQLKSVSIRMLAQILNLSYISNISHIYYLTSFFILYHYFLIFSI